MSQINELEIYACIDGYPDYLVTSYGRVLSLRDKNGKSRIKELNQVDDKNGYKMLCLYNNRIHKNIKVHRLVALAFIPNPDNKPQVNHVDENKTNNHVSNLEWVTAKENCNHGTRNKRMGEKHRKYNEESECEYK